MQSNPGPVRMLALSQTKWQTESMSTAPSVQYSITMRLEAPAKPTTVSELTSVIEASGGSVTALDVNHSDAERVRVDLTCATRNSEHGEQIVEQLRAIEGVTIGKVSDRTFLAHLGGKLTIESKLPIRNRDDLSLIYTCLLYTSDAADE